MKAEHLKKWLRDATREKYPDTKKWDKLVSITQVEFRDGYIPESMTWTMMLLITMVLFRYIGKGLFDVIWKVCTSIVNIWLRSTTVLHDALHGF